MEITRVTDKGVYTVRQCMVDIDGTNLECGIEVEDEFGETEQYLGELDFEDEDAVDDFLESVI